MPKPGPVQFLMLANLFMVEMKGEEGEEGGEVEVEVDDLGGGVLGVLPRALRYRRRALRGEAGRGVVVEEEEGRPAI
jgi:hypothetical protein